MSAQVSTVKAGLSVAPFPRRVGEKEPHSTKNRTLHPSFKIGTLNRVIMEQPQPHKTRTLKTEIGADEPTPMTEDVHPEQLSEQDSLVFAASWNLATNYQMVGRIQESVEYYLVSAAILERSGQYPKQIYEMVLTLDQDNALAASRLDPSAVSRSRGALFVQHVLSRHDVEQILETLKDEERRRWVTPPRGNQRACPECGMGIAEGQTVCAMCGAKLQSAYQRRSTAAYSVTADGSIEPIALAAASTNATADEAQAPIKQMDPSPKQESSSPVPNENADDLQTDPIVPRTQADRTDTAKIRISNVAGIQNSATPPVGRQVNNAFVALVDMEGKPLGQAAGPVIEVGSAVGRLGTGRPGLADEQARIEWNGSAFTVRTADGAPVHVVVHGEFLCQPGQHVQVGRQVLRIDSVPKGIQVALLGPNGQPTIICAFKEDRINLGASDASLSFPQDPYLAPGHAELVRTDQGVLLRDLDTDSGTFVSLPSPAEVSPGTVLRFGDYFASLDLSGTQN